MLSSLELAAVWAVAARLYAVTPDELAGNLFPGRHPSYLAEWSNRFERGFAFAVARMDNDTFRHFVEQAVALYGKEGLERFSS